MSKETLLEEFDDEENEEVDRCLTLWEEFERNPSVENAVEAIYAESQYYNGFYPGEGSEAKAIELLVKTLRKESNL